jgi:uncharacterized protein
MINFEWDDAKAKSNFSKHHVRFDVAVRVFADPFCMTTQDRIVDGELRWQSIGLVDGVVVLLVAHTVTQSEADGIETIRIVSARRADRQERKRYEQNR